jgi:glycosyltransferase involved in cell wall biosynthesis
MFAINSQRRGSGGGMPRLFVDLTTSLALAEMPPIGILRVEEEIGNRLLESFHRGAIPVVFRDDGRMMALSPVNVARIFAARSKAGSQETHLRTRDTRGTPAATVSPGRPRLKTRAIAGLRRAARAGVARMPVPVRDDMRAILIHSGQIVRKAIYGAATPRQGARIHAEITSDLRMAVHPGPGDVLWTAGLYSNCVPLRAIAELRARTGLRVVATCFDLIRVTHPQFNPLDMATELFQGDAVALLDAADLVLAISEDSRRELLTLAERTGRRAPPVQVVRLGVDFGARKAQAAADPPVVPQDFPPDRFALAVGTVEPRKNYGLLVRAWERLAADSSFPLDLVIVGRPGYGADASVAEIERSSLFGRRILWLENCSDAMLRRLYKTCHLVLCPSFAEGWGLPVAEALSFGRHVIAADRGALPEAGQGLAQLLDPQDEESWRLAIAAAAAAPRRSVIAVNLPTWEAAAATVADALRPFMQTNHTD